MGNWCYGLVVSHQISWLFCSFCLGRTWFICQQKQVWSFLASLQGWEHKTTSIYWSRGWNDTEHEGQGKARRKKSQWGRGRQESSSLTQANSASAQDPSPPESSWQERPSGLDSRSETENSYPFPAQKQIFQNQTRNYSPWNCLYLKYL